MIGRERKRVDIVAYASRRACAENDQGAITLIGETKDPGIKESDGQVLSYISGTSANGGFWTNGHMIQFLHKNIPSGVVSDWIGLPRFGKSWDSVGKYRKKDLTQPYDLKLAFRRCHNALYRTGVQSEDVALDMVRILLAKIEDEKSIRDDCDFCITPSEFSDPSLRSEACKRVRMLFSQVRDRFPDVFQPHEEISVPDTQLAIVVSLLQPYTFLEAPYDILGTAYETYVASHLKGERGQFFTNRLVVNMMVEMLEPRHTDVVLDPACGSGGFLISAFQKVSRDINNSKRIAAAKQQLVVDFANNSLFGIDISPKLVKVAKANMLLSRDGHTGVVHGNSLGKYSELPQNIQTSAGKGKATVILTNPPFGSGHDLRIKEGEILANFHSGHLWAAEDGGKLVYGEALNTRHGVAAEILFLERCIDWLRPGGKLGIVMAKGQLDNKDALAIRRILLDQCKLLAVVNLHEDTFQPFVGSRASVIFAKKKEPQDREDYRVFMAISNKVGQSSRGEPQFRRNIEGEFVLEGGSYRLDEDLSEIAANYRAYLRGELAESAYHFSISRESIAPETLCLNPTHYLPKHNQALQKVLALTDSPQFEVRRLSDLANGRVFNGPRFKRPYAELGETDGPYIRKYFTGTALTQLRGDNVKYLDTRKGGKKSQQDLEALTIKRGYLLVSDSGTLGRVNWALQMHDGHVATNNLIRVIIDDEYLRGYVYQFLISELGQSLMLMNEYGTNQQHLEPDHLANLPVPVPVDYKVIQRVGEKVIQAIESLEASIEATSRSGALMADVLGTR